MSYPWEASFLARVDKRGEDECWLWTGSNAHGRTQFHGRGIHTAATRLAWLLWRKEPIPPSKMVVHTCMSTACVNPKHLALGTHRDRLRHGEREVACVRCGGKSMRGPNVQPERCLCDACRGVQRKEATIKSRKSLRVYARRYRILMHFLGYEDARFNELLDEVKRSPMAFRRKPEGQQAGRDLAAESRFRRNELGARKRLLEAYAEGVEMPDLIERFGMDGGNINKIAERAGVKRPADFDGRYKRGAA